MKALVITKAILEQHKLSEDEYKKILEILGREAARPLTVILERDGAYPPMETLLGQLRRAREALGAGRAVRSALAEVA